MNKWKPSTLHWSVQSPKFIFEVVNEVSHFTRQTEVSSLSVSTKCRNLHSSSYLLKDFTKGKNGVSVDFQVLQYA